MTKVKISHLVKPLKTSFLVFFLCFLISLFILIWIFNSYLNEKDLNTKASDSGKVEILNTSLPTKVLNVEIADEKEEWTRGYSFRKGFDDFDGMFFIFPDSKKRYFHMKDVLFPLDIIFINEKGLVVNLERNLPSCFEEDCPIYESEGNAKYVLEIPGGFAEKYGIDEGVEVRMIF